MKSELIDRLKEVNKNFLPFLIENSQNGNGLKMNLSRHFDSFLNTVKVSFNGCRELICMVPTFYQLEEIEPWRVKEFEYLRAFTLADEDSLHSVLNAQIALSKKTDSRFSNSVLHYLNSEGWNGRCTVLIKIVDNSDFVTFGYNTELDLLIYEIGDVVAGRIKNHVRSLFPDVSENFLTVTENSSSGYVLDLAIGEKKPKKEVQNLISLIGGAVRYNDERPYNSAILNLQDALLEPVLQHTIFLQPEWEMYYCFSNTVHYQVSNSSNVLKSDYGLGGAFVIIDKEISKHHEFDRFIMLTERIVDKLANRVVNYYQIKKISEYARGSGVSAVMSRNMSHNIGSHVLSRLAKKYSKELFDNKKESLTSDEIVQIGHFFSYLMRRMDFLADIATTVPVMTTTAEFVKEIFNPFKDNILLKQHITGNDLRFDIYPPARLNGLYISIPNDILGKHAIYTIFENVIRNSAKHGSHQGDTFNIDIECSTDVNHPDYIKFTIFDDSINKDAKALAAELNRKIDLPLLYNNTLRKEAWGMLEMKIAAAYLRKIPLSSIDDRKWNTTASQHEAPPLLKATVVYDVHLGYEFYLLRPKEGVIIHPEKRMERIHFGSSSEQISSFQDYGDISEYSIIGFNYKELNPSEISTFETHPGKFTKRFLTHFESKHSHPDIETLWKNWLKSLAQKKGIRNIELTFESDVVKPDTIEDLTICQIGRSIKATFVHHPKDKLPEADYVESTSGYSLFTRFNDPDNNSTQLKYYLIEGILTDIILLDERVQEFAVDTTLDESIPITLQQYYGKLGIHIPSREKFWLNDPYSNEYREKIEEWLIQTLPSADFFVVHIGVLEKVLQLSNYTDSKKSVHIAKYLQYLSKFSPDIFNKIIFISGRGRPDTIPAEYRFLNYSNIDQLLEKRICKSTLTALLYSARSYEEII